MILINNRVQQMQARFGWFLRRWHHTVAAHLFFFFLGGGGGGERERERRKRGAGGFLFYSFFSFVYPVKTKSFLIVGIYYLFSQ